MSKPEEVALVASEDPALVVSGREVEGQADGGNDQLVDDQVEQDEVEWRPELGIIAFLFQSFRFTCVKKSTNL